MPVMNELYTCNIAWYYINSLSCCDMLITSLECATAFYICYELPSSDFAFKGLTLQQFQ